MELVFEAEDESRNDLLTSLYEWLKRSDQLVRSPVELVARPGSPGEMGGISDLLLNLDVVEILAAVSALMAWMQFRGVDIDMERTADGVVKIRLRRTRRRDAREIQKQLTELLYRSSEKRQDEERTDDGDDKEDGADRRP